MLLDYPQGRMSVVDRTMALPLWLPHNRIQADMGCSCLSPGSAGTLLWDKAGPEQSLLDNSGPTRKSSTTKWWHSVLQNINSLAQTAV